MRYLRVDRSRLRPTGDDHFAGGLEEKFRILSTPDEHKSFDIFGAIGLRTICGRRLLWDKAQALMRADGINAHVGLLRQNTDGNRSKRRHAQFCLGVCVNLPKRQSSCN